MSKSRTDSWDIITAQKKSFNYTQMCYMIKWQGRPASLSWLRGNRRGKQDGAHIPAEIGSKRESSNAGESKEK